MLQAGAFLCRKYINIIMARVLLHFFFIPIRLLQVTPDLPEVQNIHKKKGNQVYIYT